MGDRTEQAAGVIDEDRGVPTKRGLERVEVCGEPSTPGEESSTDQLLARRLLRHVRRSEVGRDLGPLLEPRENPVSGLPAGDDDPARDQAEHHEQRQRDETKTYSRRLSSPADRAFSRQRDHLVDAADAP